MTTLIAILLQRREKAKTGSARAGGAPAVIA